MKKTVMMVVAALILVPVLAFAATERTVRASESTNEIQAKVQELKTARVGMRETIKAEILEKTKKVAMKAIDRSLSRYQKVADRVSEMPNISETEKAGVRMQIAADIEKLKLLKARVEAATTVEEVRSVMTELRTTLKVSKTAVAAKVDAIHATRLQGVTTKLTTILEKLSAKVSDLKNSGKNVAELEVIEASAKSKIETARTLIAANKLPEAKESILEARKSLIELAQKIKAEK